MYVRPHTRTLNPHTSSHSYAYMHSLAAGLIFAVLLRVADTDVEFGEVDLALLAPRPLLLPDGDDGGLVLLLLLGLLGLVGLVGLVGPAGLSGLGGGRTDGDDGQAPVGEEEERVSCGKGNVLLSFLLILSLS